MTTATPVASGRLGELVLYFLRLGLLGFGGPVARWSASLWRIEGG
jgi:chromate transporter